MNVKAFIGPQIMSAIQCLEINTCSRIQTEEKQFPGIQAPLLLYTSDKNSSAAELRRPRPRHLHVISFTHFQQQLNPGQGHGGSTWWTPDPQIHMFLPNILIFSRSNKRHSFGKAFF